jgi:predicted RNase H-like nuclease (RuvC/YqgF family)
LQLYFFIIVFFVQDVVARFAVTCCAIIFIGNTALGVIFIPKLKLLFKYTPEQLQKMNDEQLNSMIRGFSKKFESPSVRTSTKESKTTHPVVVDSSGVRARDTVQVSTVSSLEDEISKLSSNVHIVSAKNEELRKENAELKAHISRLTYEGSKTTDDNAS